MEKIKAIVKKAVDENTIPQKEFLDEFKMIKEGLRDVKSDIE